MPAAPYFLFSFNPKFPVRFSKSKCVRDQTHRRAKSPSRGEARRAFALRRLLRTGAENQDAAALGARLRELRWKNSAWLATADTIAGWNGFEIRNAGSGRSPARSRSG